MIRWTLALLLLASCASVTTSNPADIAQQLTRAIEQADVDGAMALFADDATVYFPINDVPLRADGRAAIEAVFRKYFTSPSRGHFEPANLHVQRAGDAAIVTFEIRNPNVTSRRTLVLRARGGTWKIVHLHASNIRPNG
ncbi:MAG TPA: nuclear transport factor 2 family protein [Thermoanaerobaculia bacterium]|nr:nuclear transport factor 2 family protein [Thermoanaerobaculia bacterium]